MKKKKKKSGKRGADSTYCPGRQKPTVRHCRGPCPICKDTLNSPLCRCPTTVDVHGWQHRYICGWQCLFLCSFLLHKRGLKVHDRRWIQTYPPTHTHTPPRPPHTHTHHTHTQIILKKMDHCLAEAFRRARNFNNIIWSCAIECCFSCTRINMHEKLHIEFTGCRALEATWSRKYGKRNNKMIEEKTNYRLFSLLAMISR